MNKIEVLAQTALFKGLRGNQTNAGISFRLSMTHNQLASRVGTVREVVTRAMQRLQSQNLIGVNGKEISIPDVSALRRYVDSQ